MSLERNRIVLAKIESSYGTDPTPTGAANSILVKNLNRVIYEGNRVSRDVVYTYMGNDEEVNTGPFVTVTFDVEFAGGSAAGTAPQFGVLLRACGLAEVVSASTSVTYNPISSSHESATLYFNYDGENQVIVGARGTMRLGCQRGAIPMPPVAEPPVLLPPLGPKPRYCAIFVTPVPMKFASMFVPSVFM